MSFRRSTNRDIDAGERGNLVGLHAAAQRLGHVVDAVLGGRGDEALEVRLVKLVLAIAPQAEAAVFHGAHGLAERFLERAADGHDLADGFHARGQRVVGAFELLEGEARDLGHDVVDRRLEAGGRSLGDVVRDLGQRVAHRELGCHLGDGKARRLGRERRRAAHARVHLDDDEAAVVGVDGKLHVGAARLDADLFEDGERRVAHVLVLDVGKRLRRGDGDGVARVHAHGVEVLDGAHDDAVAGLIAHDLHLVFLPADDRLLDEHLARRRELEALAHDLAQLVDVVGDATARAAQREARTEHEREAQLARELLGVLDAVGIAALGHLEADALHGLGEQLAVLAFLDGLEVAADHLDAVLVERAVLGKLHRAVERRLPAHVGQDGVRALLGDDLGDDLGRDGLDVGAVGRFGVGHDGRGVGVDEDDLVPLGLQDLAGLCAGVVELAGLADDDGAGADDHDLVQVISSWHA